jgi:hypothetical protein
VFLELFLLRLLAGAFLFEVTLLLEVFFTGAFFLGVVFLGYIAIFIPI